jgi:site-specific DNA-methyltransferase (cytosine-N4-specific)
MLKIPEIKDTSVKQGWFLRNIIIWHKPNHMPSSVKDRFTNAYEPVFMLVKNRRYWFDLEAVRELR